MQYAQVLGVSSGVAHQHISSVTLCIATAVISFALPQPAGNKIIVPRSTSKLSSEYNVILSFDQLELVYTHSVILVF